MGAGIHDGDHRKNSQPLPSFTEIAGRSKRLSRKSQKTWRVRFKRWVLRLAWTRTGVIGPEAGLRADQGYLSQDRRDASLSETQLRPVS